MMVLCSRLLKSNIRTLPSAPQLTKTSTLLAQNRTSKTSLSCAISCVLAVNVGISQIVQVVSMLEVIIRLGDNVFQSREVKGAVCSGDFELESRASGVSFWGTVSLVFDVRVMDWLVVELEPDGSRNYFYFLRDDFEVDQWAVINQPPTLLTLQQFCTAEQRSDAICSSKFN